MHIAEMDNAIDQGTLLWIGDRNSVAFRDAYAFCEAHVAQLAYRSDINSAISRPAAAVRTILYCCDNDSSLSTEWFDQIRQRHPDGKGILLLGPLCAGARPSPVDLFGVSAINWHEWESVLPAHLRRCGWADRSESLPRSIAVVAESYANASALLEIAGSGDATSVWCRLHQLRSIDHFDEIWWDDSATKGRSWSSLLQHLSGSPDEHVWVSGDVTPRAKQLAANAGVGLTISKPGDFSKLINRVCGVALERDRYAA